MRNLTASEVLPAPAPDDVREQLNRIVSSDEFRIPDRGRRFLRYVVDETLSGRSQYLKAYTIAQEVFGRSARFDAQNDPCVRMAASQIRRSLERYYLVAGGGDSVVISIPRGQYAPTFTANRQGVMTAQAPRDNAGAAQETSIATPPESDSLSSRPQRGAPGGSRLSRWLLIGAAPIVAAAVAIASLAERYVPPGTREGIPTVRVALSDNIGQDASLRRISWAIADELLVNLSRSKDLVVITPKSPPGALPTFVLEGRIRMQDRDLRSVARLVRSADGAVVWSGIYEINTAGQAMLDVETTIARSISTAVIASSPSR